ncbi:tRNA epoxyqueuosine(34) reductase QueG [Pullulanibacillus sp. KACC 23026]|uniref:tRNA epoxyqueuosine(34) reductase QueG n=1 Tax=Pullulanibacillus sp. KACC 23026 TaxID=3028315 RepID=UPI0023AFD146|nr:tRNA epoxyqueuosine(34) reductase QueG [Pullulanibacillus sp. KACC 23026]WEG12160.1 tRNA epoxyqueuosine(34) reductase QueG [Pullulanibacillus sp. KACC 23026]
MNIQELKQSIIAYSQTIGIDKIGFTTADPFHSLRNRLYQQQMLGYQSGFEAKDIERRVNPTQLMDGAASIISIALAYPSKLKEKPPVTKESRRGSFSRASWGLDYHQILKDRLEKLEAFILERYPEALLKSMVDTGELSDRAVAERAGIGFVSKNTNLITKEYGSYVYLGEMLTNIPFEPDQPVENLCGDCTLCLDTCPTGALVQGGQLNAQKCIAFLTQTKKKVPEPYRKAIGNRVYGCDTCQQVCPYNRGKDFHFHSEMEPDPEKVKPELKPLLSLSNRDFYTAFGKMAGSWRGKKPIQRNAILALGNYKDKTAIDVLQAGLKTDPRPDIRETIVWALREIGKAHADTLPTITDLLIKQKNVETHESVCIEIDKTLQQLHQKERKSSHLTD